MKQIGALFLITAITQYSCGMQPALLGPESRPAAAGPQLSDNRSLINSFIGCAELGKTGACRELLGKTPGIVDIRDARGRTALHAAIDGAFQPKNHTNGSAAGIRETIAMLLKAHPNPHVIMDIDGVKYSSFKEYIEEKAKKFPRYFTDEYYQSQVNYCLMPLLDSGAADQETAKNNNAGVPKDPVQTISGPRAPRQAERPANPVPEEQTDTQEPAAIANQAEYSKPSELEIQIFITGAWRGNTAQCKQLLDKYGKDIINKKGHPQFPGYTALHAAIQGAFAGYNDTPEFARWLLNNGAHPNIAVIVDGTPYAVIEYIELLKKKHSARWNTRRGVIEDVCFPLLQKTAPAPVPTAAPAQQSLLHPAPDANPDAQQDPIILTSSRDGASIVRPAEESEQKTSDITRPRVRPADESEQKTAKPRVRPTQPADESEQKRSDTARPRVRPADESEQKTPGTARPRVRALQPAVSSIRKKTENLEIQQDLVETPEINSKPGASTSAEDVSVDRRRSLTRFLGNNKLTLLSLFGLSGSILYYWLTHKTPHLENTSKLDGEKLSQSVVWNETTPLL